MDTVHKTKEPIAKAMSPVFLTLLKLSFFQAALYFEIGVLVSFNYGPGIVAFQGNKVNHATTQSMVLPGNFLFNRADTFSGS